MRETRQIRTGSKKLNDGEHTSMCSQKHSTDMDFSTPTDRLFTTGFFFLPELKLFGLKHKVPEETRLSQRVKQIGIQNKGTDKKIYMCVCG